MHLDLWGEQWVLREVPAVAKLVRNIIVTVCNFESLESRKIKISAEREREKMKAFPINFCGKQIQR